MDKGRFKRKKHIRIKIISMGERNTGKSCLIKRYCEKKFVSKYIMTIGVDFGVRPVVIDVSLQDALACGRHKAWAAV